VSQAAQFVEADAPSAWDKCPICGAGRRNGCKPSASHPGGIICRGPIHALWATTGDKQYTCLGPTPADPQFSLWKPTATVVRSAAAGGATLPDRLTREQRRADFRKRAASLGLTLEAIEALERTGEDGEGISTQDLAEHWAGLVLPEEPPPRVVLTAEQRATGLEQLLLADTGADALGQRNLLPDHQHAIALRYGGSWSHDASSDWLSSIGPAWPTESELYAISDGQLRWRDGQQLALPLPVPGAQTTATGELVIWAAAGLWWPITGLDGQLLGVEIESDWWRRLLGSCSWKYRPLSAEAATTRSPASPWTWRVVAGLRLEPPMGLFASSSSSGQLRRQELQRAEGLVLTEGRAVKPRITAARWGLPAAGGHGQAAFPAMRQQLADTLAILPRTSPAILAPDAGATQNWGVLRNLVATAALAEHIGNRTALVAWWGQRNTANRGPGLHEIHHPWHADPDELVLTGPVRPGHPLPWACSWLVLPAEAELAVRAWLEAASGDGGLAITTPAALALQQQLEGYVGGAALVQTLTHHTTAPHPEPRSAALHLTVPITRLRTSDGGPIQFAPHPTEDGGPGIRVARPARQLQLLPVAQWIEQHVPELLLETHQCTNTDGTMGQEQTEHQPRQQLLADWRDGTALAAATGNRLPPLPPRSEATSYPLADRREAWGAAITNVRQLALKVHHDTLANWAEADGLTPDDLLPPGESLEISSNGSSDLGLRQQILDIRRDQRLQQLLAQHYSAVPGRAAAVLLVADRPGLGKTHAAALYARQLAVQLGLRYVLWIQKSSGVLPVAPLAALNAASPPVRRAALVLDGGRQRQARPGEDWRRLPPGLELVDPPTCEMAHDLHRLAARGFSHEAINDWCTGSCPLAGSCSYKAQTGEFWSIRGSRQRKDGTTPTPRVDKGDVVLTTPAFLPALLAMAPGYCRRALVIADESDHLLAAASQAIRIRQADLAGLMALAVGWQQKPTLAEIGQPELLLELLHRLHTLCGGDPEQLRPLGLSVGVHGLSPGQMLEAMARWRLQATEALAHDRGAAAPAERTHGGLMLPSLWEHADQQLDIAGVGATLSPSTPAAADATPPMLQRLVEACLGDLAARGSSTISLVPVALGRGRSGAGPRFELELRWPTGLLRRLAEAAGSVVVLDGTGSARELRNALNAAPGSTEIRRWPIALTAIEAESADGALAPNAHQASGAEDTNRGPCAAIRVLQVQALGGCTRQRRDTHQLVRDALIADVADWIRKQQGAEAEVGVLDHRPYARVLQTDEMAAAGIRPEGEWFTSTARGGNGLMGVRALVSVGLPIENLNAAEAAVRCLADWGDGGGASLADQQLEIQLQKAQRVGQELLQGWGRPRWNRMGHDWGTGVLVAVTTADLSQLVAALPNATLEQWEPEQFGTRVAEIRAQQTTSRGEAISRGQRQQGSKRQQQQAAQAQQIEQEILRLWLEYGRLGLSPQAMLARITTRRISDALGIHEKTARATIRAMAQQLSPALAKRPAAQIEVAAAVLEILKARVPQFDAQALGFPG
jgi:hypothetical protein